MTGSTLYFECSDGYVTEIHKDAVQHCKKIGVDPTYNIYLRFHKRNV